MSEIVQRCCLCQLNLTKLNTHTHNKALLAQLSEAPDPPDPCEYALAFPTSLRVDTCDGFITKLHDHLCACTVSLSILKSFSFLEYECIICSG